MSEFTRVIVALYVWDVWRGLNIRAVGRIGADR